MTTATISPVVSSYLSNSKAIVKAGDALAEALASTASQTQKQQQIDYRIEGLKNAVSLTTGKQAGKLGFSATATTAPEPQSLTVDEILTVAAADATVAQLLFAASQAVGEQVAPKGSEPLRAAVRSADTELQQLQSSQASALAFSATQQRRFFSPGIAQANQTFQSQAGAAIDHLVDESDKAVVKIFDLLQARKTQIIEGFSEAGQLFEAASSVAVLLRKAWEKLLSALQAIRQIAALAPVQEVLHELKTIVGSISVHGELEMVFGSVPLRAEVNALQPQRTLDEIDERSTEVALLEERFAALVSNIRTVTRIIAVVGPLVTVHFVGPFAALAVPAAYSLAIVAIVLLGKDYTQAGRLNAGRGIRIIVEELKLPAMATAG